MTKDQFVDVTDLIVMLFPKENIEFSKPVADAWYEALSDLDYEKVRSGIVKYSQENQWSPTIADIRKYAPKSNFTMSEEAFNRICEEHGA